jgi:hypothetical protein
MNERRAPSASSTRPSVRRNLFQQHLSRRPTTSSTSTSAETLRLDVQESESHTSDLVRRDQNGDYEIGDPVVPLMDEQDEEMGHGADMAEEDSKCSHTRRI